MQIGSVRGGIYKGYFLCPISQCTNLWLYLQRSALQGRGPTLHRWGGIKTYRRRVCRRHYTLPRYRTMIALEKGDDNLMQVMSVGRSRYAVQQYHPGLPRAGLRLGFHNANARCCSNPARRDDRSPKYFSTKLRLSCQPQHESNSLTFAFTSIVHFASL